MVKDIERSCKKMKFRNEEEFFAECRNAGCETIVLNKHGKELDFESVVQFMDGEIMEYLHAELSPCSLQLFYEAYCVEHKIKFGEHFFTEEGENITW